jgi:hypothetical protein
MIQLTPSVGIQRETKIDYKVLSSVITLILEKNFNIPLNYKIKINKSRDPHASCVIINCNQHYQRNFVMNLASYKSIKEYISTIIHEIRHVLQHTIFRHSIVATFRTTRDYYNSAEEIDARKFEKLTTVITKSYKLIAETSQQIFEKNNLGTLL